MTGHEESVVVIGGGIGGYSLVKELRARGHQGDITLIDAEGYPYDRPPLSKDYLLGKQTLEDLQFAPVSWYEENNIKVVSGSAQSVDAESKTVTLENGDSYHGDVLVFATGGRARSLNIEGAGSPRIHVLRDLSDADSLKEVLASGDKRTVIIGGGLIGAEAASSLLSFVGHVTLIDHSDIPLIPAVGFELAERLHMMHTENGIKVLKGVVQQVIENEDSATIILGDGNQVEADIILVGIGITPNTEIAEASGLEVNDGIIVDESQQTSIPGIYAVGDVARVRDANGSLKRRAGHWENALNSGITAAAAILHQELPEHGASWFWSDRHGIHLEGVGRVHGEGQKIHREENGQVTTTFLLNEDGTMAGCAAIDGGLTVRAARRIIDRKIIVDPEKLADSTIPLKKLAR